MTFRRKSLTTHHMFNQVFNLLLLLPFLSYCSFASARKDDGIDRIFSSEELSGYVGKDGGQIYLSVLGEVYDVTEGKDYYGEGSSYSFFAGADRSACFFSGDFTEEGAKKNILDYTPTQIKSLEEWRSFYEKHEKYSFVGKLEGQFYDSSGEPTQYLKDVTAKMSVDEVKTEL
mmetsp:Transcript_2436/g.4538  ORF Transcript_2436/g.4538 Transcript_2436/m.4538 type:complete len:173 (-) Transcript_2436:687-1205(-)